MRSKVLGAAGRDRAASRFSWQRVTAETVRVYERATVAADARDETAEDRSEVHSG